MKSQILFLKSCNFDGSFDLGICMGKRKSPGEGIQAFWSCLSRFLSFTSYCSLFCARIMSFLCVPYTSSRLCLINNLMSI